MDLRAWIVDEHRLANERLEQQVLAHVPVERHGDLVDGGGSSITFLLWHLARHQDLAVNAVARRREQVVERHHEAVGATGLPPGTGLAEAEDRAVTAAFDPGAVVAYHAAVAGETQLWLETVDLSDLDGVPDAPAALAAAGVAEADVPWLYRMWDGKPVAFHVMWEAIGHGVTHVGEMVSMRNRMGLSPF